MPNTSSGPQILALLSVVGDQKIRSTPAATVDEISSVAQNAGAMDTTVILHRHAEQFMYLLGEVSVTRRPEWAAPTGYSSYASRRERMAKLAGYRTTTVVDQVAAGTLVAGTPATVIAAIRRWLEETRVGSLVLHATEGRIPHEATRRCIELLGAEVLPAVREIGAALGIRGPFDAQ